MAAAMEPNWHLVPHLALLDDAVVRLIRGDLPSNILLVLMPPRHGKSEYCCGWLPPWYINKWPDRRIILCSYEATFAATWGRKSRNRFIRLGPYGFPARLSLNKQAESEWETDIGGGMRTAGVGGGITGRGGNVLITDDLIKNAEQAASETYRNKTWDWWRSTAFTRLEPGGVCVVIGTPWHRDDVLARIKNELDPYVVQMPAIARPGDPLGREDGEALWPARFGVEALAKIKATLGPYYWSALYATTPSQHERAEWPQEYFKDIWYEQLPQERIVHRVLALDPSLGANDKSDFQAYVMLALSEDGLVYVDADISRRDLVSMVDAGLAISAAFQPQVWSIEVNAFHGLDHLTVERSKGIMPPIATVVQHKNKPARIRLGVGPYLAYRKLRFKHGSTGATTLVEQLKDFPIGEHEDGPDALEIGLRVMREIANRGGITTPTPAAGMVTT